MKSTFFVLTSVFLAISAVMWLGVKSGILPNPNVPHAQYTCAVDNGVMTVQKKWKDGDTMTIILSLDAVTFVVIENYAHQDIWVSLQGVGDYRFQGSQCAEIFATYFQVPQPYMPRKAD